MTDRLIGYDVFPCSLPCFCENFQKDCSKCFQKIVWDVCSVQKFFCGHYHEARGRITLSKKEAVAHCERLRYADDCGDSPNLHKFSKEKQENIISIFPCQTFCCCTKRKDNCHICCSRIDWNPRKKAKYPCGCIHELVGSIELTQEDMKKFCSDPKVGTIRKKETLNENKKLSMSK